MDPSPESARERRWQWTVGVGCVIALFSLGGNILLSITNITKDQQIVNLLNQHSDSYTQQAQQAQRQAAYDKDVLLFAETIEGELAALCSGTHSTCPPLPRLPGQ